VVALLAAALWGISVLGGDIAEKVASVAVGIFSHLGTSEIRPEAVGPWAPEALKTILSLLMPTGVVCFVAAILMGGAQTQFILTPKVLGIKFDRLDPVAGFQRIFSVQGVVRVIMEAARLGAVAWVIWGGVTKVMNDPIFYTPVPIQRLGAFILDSAVILLWRCILALGIIAVANYAYQYVRIRKSLMMTKQEVRDEMKQSEGDPKIKSALRAMARRLLQRQMLDAVKTADVVITNPVHFAVALRYDKKREAAPTVIAKGEQAFARRLKAVALEAGVPMVENPPVARMLYKFGKVGNVIPVNLYRAVAEILAFVYRTHSDYFGELQRKRDQS
ncbi:MAG: EscU/YscU/HrcU family type III secretion system export apparatus switch protein, partial [Verrucomicrobiota bacterium]